ncbi:nerve growth factor [Anguilla rostrata]|uniref:nerve growth factor n=1 Tax=Anguilla rostrata TaxID=7938 RepID=UPI0030D4D979
MRSTTLGLLFLFSVRAVFNMGGGVQAGGTSRQRRAQSGLGGGRGTPSGGGTPHSTTNLSVSTTDPELLAGKLRSAHGTGAKLHNAASSSSSTLHPKLFPKPPTSVPAPHPNLPDASPSSNPAPGPELSDEPLRNVPGASPKLFVESPDGIPTVDPKLFNKRRYRSPRVLFSAHPPDAEGGGARVRRRAAQPRHRGVYSVCDSVSNWVGNKTTAIDITGNEVTVLPDVRVNNIVKKQYFFETTCHVMRGGGGGGGGGGRAGAGAGSCLGIDSRHWNSYCTNTHTFVLAMTSFKSLVAWRLVRINAACVCVLSRKSWRQ